MTDLVRLRPISLDDIPALELLREEENASYNWFGFAQPGRLRRNVTEGTTFGEDNGALTVVRAAQVLGDVSWHVESYGPNRSHAFNMGISLLPAARGKGYGTRAQRLLAEYLFANTAVNRLEASTDITNIAEQKSLAKAGFTREGVLRGAQFRNGKWNDLVLYSFLREDLTEDADGTQG